MAKQDDLIAAAAEIRALCAIVTRHARQDLEERLERSEARARAGVLQNLQAERLTLADLSRHMMIIPSTFVTVIDGLEEKGLVKRGRDPNDRAATPSS